VHLSRRVALLTDGFRINASAFQPAKRSVDALISNSGIRGTVAVSVKERGGVEELSSGIPSIADAFSDQSVSSDRIAAPLDSGTQPTASAYLAVLTRESALLPNS